MSSFRFSPRPNRAHEIQWREWGAEAFEAARQQGKLILLGISGVWCHWCHVMDETTYSDPEVICLINEKFIPIRVDTDQRPDVNERYNMGGWPTTAALTPTGEILSGGTYIPPERIKPWLVRLAATYESRREAIEAEAVQLRAQDEARLARHQVPAPIEPHLYDEVLKAVQSDYDPVYGGFGREPKFPMTAAIELAMDAYFRSRDPQLREIFTKTLLAMAGGGMYDKVEGGFFRYSTTRDWSIPHFEKMLEDHADLLECLLRAFGLTGEDAFLEIARDALRYLENNLYLPVVRGWAGTQDADEEYYALGSLAERLKHEAPFIDRHVYVNWNAMLARSLMLAGPVLGEPKWTRLGLETLEMLLRRCYKPSQGMAHYFDATEAWKQDKPDLAGPGQNWGLLHDQVTVSRACARAYQATGDARWLERARTLAGFALERLQAPRGGFYSAPPDRSAPGALARPKQDFRDNALAARWLLELAALLESGGAADGSEAAEAADAASRYRQAAARALQAVGHDWARYGVMAAGYALAVAATSRPWTAVHVVETGELPGLTLAALTTPRPHTVVHRLSAAQSPQAVTRLGHDPGRAAAYVCIGTRCLAPISDADQLAQTLSQAQP